MNRIVPIAKEYIPQEVKEDADRIAREIVEFYKDNNIRDDWGTPQYLPHYQGVIGMLMLEIILKNLGYKCELDKNMAGRSVHFDIIISGKRCEVKTSKIKFGDFNWVINRPTYNFIVKERQYKNGENRMVAAYFSMLIDAEFEYCALMGWCRNKFEGEAVQNINAPNFQIPYADLNKDLVML